MLEDYEIKVLDHFLLDRNKWASHAVAEKIYPDEETALHDKASKCLPRMILQHESSYSKLDDSLSNAEKVIEILKEATYKNRAARDALFN